MNETKFLDYAKRIDEVLNYLNCFQVENVRARAIARVNPLTDTHVAFACGRGDAANQIKKDIEKILRKQVSGVKHE